MEGYQRELRRQSKQYDAIQENDWKKIVYLIIIQYHNIAPPPFQMGFNIQVVMGPTKVQKKQLAMYYPRLEKHHTPQYNHSQSLA
jgi:hypothetical protein